MFRILIIDDQETIIAMLKRRLSKHDYAFDSCDNVKDARNFLKKQNIDLILTDYMMPEVSGYDFFLSIQNKEEIPVIMMTAHASINLATEFIKNGGADFIEKPIDIDILHLKIVRAIHNFRRINNEKLHRLEAEEKLLQSYEDLQKKSKEIQLVNNQLELFAGIIAHDLKSPLSSHKLLLDFLLKKIKTNPDHFELQSLVSQLTILRNNSVEMLVLVDALMELTLIHKGVFALQQVDIAQMVSEIIESLHPESFVYFKVNNLEKVVCEPILMKQVFTNLIQNAIKYSSVRKEPVIEISSVRDQSGVTFSIKDNGIGLKKEDLEDIFSMFARIETDHEIEGSGIGLAVVKKIVERHNGKIWAESEYDQWTCIYFTLPLSV